MTTRPIMTDLVHILYQEHVYPPMSHPLADPAMTAAAARLAGLAVPPPATARIFEIGCCSGHHLIPLAMRWPASRCVGIDLAESSVALATRRAAQAGVENVRFFTADLREFIPGDGPFDFIIAHGFLSWVPPDVQAALFRFCQANLSPTGIATVSFNVECGWKHRFPVIEKARAILAAGATSVMQALEILRTVTEVGSPEISIIDDMLARGPGILSFDDFGPVNDAWPLDRFIAAAAGAGLRWLGESDPTATEGEEISADGLHRRLAEDEAIQRTFRSEILCRDDARREKPDLRTLCLRAGAEPPGPEDHEIWSQVAGFSPACVAAGTALPGVGDEWILAGIHGGSLLPRVEPLAYDPAPPVAPRLNAFRLLCAEQRLPLVDAWHQPCSFPDNHYQILTLMDGTREHAELGRLAAAHCPELAFDPWLAYLAGRGMFTV